MNKWELLNREVIEAPHPMLDDHITVTSRLRVDGGWLYRYQESRRPPTIRFVADGAKECESPDGTE